MCIVIMARRKTDGGGNCGFSGCRNAVPPTEKQHATVETPKKLSPTKQSTAIKPPVEPPNSRSHSVSLTREDDIELELTVDRLV